MLRLGRNFRKLHVEPAVDTLHIWLKTKTPRKKSVKRKL